MLDVPEDVEGEPLGLALRRAIALAQRRAQPIVKRHPVLVLLDMLLHLRIDTVGLLQSNVALHAAAAPAAALVSDPLAAAAAAAGAATAATAAKQDQVQQRPSLHFGLRTFAQDAGLGLRF